MQLIVSALLLLCAVIAAAEVPFPQYNATLYFLQGQPPFGPYSSLPFSHPAQRAIFDPCAAAFVTQHSDGSIWMYSTDAQSFVSVAAPAVFQKPGYEAILYLPESLQQLQQCADDGQSSSYAVVTYSIAASKLEVLECSIGNTSTQFPFLQCQLAASTILPSPPSVDNTKLTAVSTLFPPSAPPSLTNSTLFIGTSRGLWLFNFAGKSFSRAAVPMHNTTGSIIATGDVSQISCVSLWGFCFVATREHLSTANAWTNDLVHQVSPSTGEYYFLRTPGIIDAIPTAFAYDVVQDALHMANEKCVNVLFRNWTLSRVEGVHGGLPQNNLTAAAYAAADGTLWFGSSRGAMLRRQDGSWKYFFGPRWLPGPAFTAGMYVRALAVGSKGQGNNKTVMTLVATSTGISIIEKISWTLEEKASSFQSIMYRHSRYGVTADSILLSQFGNISTYRQYASANDGLWTSLYLASQIFRYAATGAEDARANAWEAYNGMMMLFNVTGRKGYPARSFQYKPVDPGSLYPSPTMPGFYFESDTSSDEIDGHLHVYPLFLDLVAETPSEKAQVSQVITDLVGYIVDNNFTLIDPVTNKPTSWGFWDPAKIDGNPDWYDDRGENSLEMLTYLVNAYEVSNDTKFVTAFDYLISVHHYDLNALNAKITQPSDVNYSDDELTFVTYLQFFWAGRRGTNPLYHRLKETVWTSLKKTFDYVRVADPSLWTSIYLFAASQMNRTSETAEDAERALWNLQTWPMSWINWPTNNSARLDLRPNPHRSHTNDFVKVAETVVPYDEMTYLLWNSDPFATQQGNGYREYCPSAFLYPYWMMRYFDQLPKS